jgi:putative transcriptional regulator
MSARTLYSPLYQSNSSISIPRKRDEAGLSTLMVNGTKTIRKLTKHDWSRFDAMTAQQRHAAALSDPDAQPLGPDDFKRMKRTPQVKVIRRALGLTQEQFAERFHIPLGTLRDWEQGAAQPDQSARAYLTVIARDPEAVDKALNTPRR